MKILLILLIVLAGCNRGKYQEGDCFKMKPPFNDIIPKVPRKVTKVRTFVYEYCFLNYNGECATYSVGRKSYIDRITEPRSCRRE